MFHRRFVAVCAAIGVMGLAGLSAAPAHAAPGCPDVHWIGAAGSGERNNPTANGGMGRVIYQSLQDLSRQVQRDGRTVTAEAVNYPAVAVPDTGNLLGWAGFMNSVDTGVTALANQYAAFTQQCPSTKVVLAGYSQGAMVVHRNLQTLASSPNLAAVLLVADGDRLPADPTYNLGSATAARAGGGMGMAQQWPVMAHAPTSPLPLSVGSRTISVCDVGDPVCDAISDDEEVTPAGVAIHTGYGRSRAGGYAWTWPLYQLLAPTVSVSQLTPVGPPM